MCDYHYVPARGYNQNPIIQFLYVAEYVKFTKEDGELDELFNVATLTINCAPCAALDLISKTSVVANKLLIHMDSQSECLIRHYLVPIKTYADRSMKQGEYFCIQRHTFNKNRELIKISANHHKQLRTHIYMYMFRIPAEYYLDAPVGNYPYKPIPECPLVAIFSQDGHEIINISESDLSTYEHRYEEVIKAVTPAKSRYQYLDKVKEETPTPAQIRMQEKAKREAELNEKLATDRVAAAERAAEKAARRAAITADIAKNAAKAAELKKAEVAKVIAETTKVLKQAASAITPDLSKQTTESEMIQKLRKEAEEQIAIEREKNKVLEHKLHRAKTYARSMDRKRRRSRSPTPDRYRSPTPDRYRSPTPDRYRSPTPDRYRSRSPTSDRNYKRAKQSREYYEYPRFPLMSSSALKKRSERFTTPNKEKVEAPVDIKPLFAQDISEEDIIDLNME